MFLYVFIVFLSPTLLLWCIFQPTKSHPQRPQLKAPRGALRASQPSHGGCDVADQAAGMGNSSVFYSWENG